MELTTDLPPALVPVAWLLGTWAGAGVGGHPSIGEFRFGQEITFSHDSRPFLSYESLTWLLDDEGVTGAPLDVETGVWRRQPSGGLEGVLAHSDGVASLWLGTVAGPKLELWLDQALQAPTAGDHVANHRLYGLVEGDLLWVLETIAADGSVTPQQSARLKRG